MSENFNETNKETFYCDAANYWSEVPATLDGMLGGFGFISQTDIKGSKMLLKQIFNSKNSPCRHYALDCGAGIGRITKYLLSDLYDKVDLVEQNPKFLQQARKYLGPKIAKIGNFYSVALQHFQPESGKYDMIWVQWVLGHLTDNDLINFLTSCRNGLSSSGVIVIKENVTSTDEIVLDRQDSSVTRPMWLLRRIFEKADLDCYRQLKQHNFPKGIYTVYMFVLKPKATHINLVENSSNDNQSISNIGSQSEIVDSKVDNQTSSSGSEQVHIDVKPVSISNVDFCQIPNTESII